MDTGLYLYDLSINWSREVIILLFPQIRMQSEMAQIGIEQHLGKQFIRQPAANMSIEQPKADMTIRTKPSKLTIDQTQAWEETNLMSTRKLAKKHADNGMQIAQEGTARRAEQGTQLMRIETEGNPIKEQAIVNGHPQMKRIGMKFIPSPFSVKFYYEPSEVEIGVKVNKPIIHTKVNKPEVAYERGNVNIFMERYNHLEINVEHP